MNEIAKPGKGNHVVAEFLEAAEIAINQQVVGFDRLQAAQLRTGDETLVNHRKNRHMGLEVACGVPIDARHQAQERGLAGTVVADQCNTSA